MNKNVGIDLGTTNSLVAIMEGGEAHVIANADGSFLTPSVVAFSKDGEPLVGHLAKRQSISNPERTITSIKRYMGTDHKVHIQDRDYTPQEISAMILQKLKQDAETYLGENIQKAIITVPAYFNNAERQATKDAGTIAGLEVIRIINEPTAAAMAYGLDKLQGTQNILVFDLGGGTFDVSILAIDNGVFEVISTSGDMKLGGDDWDRRIMDYLIDAFKKSTSIDLRIDRVAMQRLREVAEVTKCALSEKESARINLPFIAADPSGPKHMDMELSRNRFEELTKDLVEKLAIPAKRALDDSKLPLAQIRKVILVGGATRMPMVQRMAKKLFGKDPSREVDPEKVVAIGAAIQGAILAGDVKDLVLLDVTSLSLGIETTGGTFTRLINRNTQIPCSQKKIFTTVADGQTLVEVRVFQGERELTQYNKFLGSVELKIPPAPRGIPQIEVTFELDTNGIVSTAARDLATGNKQKITIQSPTNLSQEEINRMLKEAAQHDLLGASIREDRQLRNKANVEIEIAEKALKDYAYLFPEDKISNIRAQIQTVKQALDERNLEKVRVETRNLQQSVYFLTKQLYASPQKASASRTPAGTPSTLSSKTPSAAEPTEAEVIDWFSSKKENK